MALWGLGGLRFLWLRVSRGCWMFVDVPIWKRICGGGGWSWWECLCVCVRNTLIAQEGTEVSYNPVRGCFEQDRFTWKVLLQVFPGIERVLQAIQWHHNKPRKTCRTPAIPWPPTFTNAVCVLYLQPRISWSTCPTVSPLTYLLSFAWHFLLKTSLYPCFPIFQTLSNKIPYNSSNFPRKAAQGCKSGHLKK